MVFKLFGMIGLQRCGLCLCVGYLTLFLLLRYPLQLVPVYLQPKIAEDEEPATKKSLLVSTSSEESLLVSTSTEGPLLVLVLSSLPRSGSSLMGELIATIPNSVYYFEPIYKFLQKGTWTNDQNITSDYIKSLFRCEIEKEFENWFKANPDWIKWWNIKAKRCYSMKTYHGKLKCFSNFNIKQDCEESNAIIMKVIRARMSWIEPFILDQSLNLKIIHIVRDPRASIKSIMQFNGWNKDAKYRCGHLHQDMKVYKTLQDKYSNTVIR
ncbi:unnamed protein product, partial [Meganyctiphanes norvegica]